MSRGQKFVAMIVLAFIALAIAGAMWGHHAPADPTVRRSAGFPISDDDDQRAGVPGGLNQLAADWHLGVSPSPGADDWLLVLSCRSDSRSFTGPTREERRPHDDDEHAAFAVVACVLRQWVRSSSAGSPHSTSASPQVRLFGHGSAGSSTHGFFLQRRGVTSAW